MHDKRRPLLAANWKQNQLWEDCERFVVGLRGRCPAYFDKEAEPPIDLLLCPPFPYLTLLGGLADEADLYIGAQDVSRFSGGAYTGEISARMLADAGCDYVLVGHSERRSVFHESDEAVRDKLERLREAELLPVLCVGEGLAEREAGRAEAFTLAQLDSVKGELQEHEVGSLVIAYEPVWAIGTGRNAEPTDAQQMAKAIRGWSEQALGKKAAAETLILYGGSVKPENIAGYFTLSDIDGALIGNASLKAESFAAMVEACSASMKGGRRRKEQAE